MSGEFDVHAIDTDAMFATLGDMRSDLAPAITAPTLTVPDLAESSGTEVLTTLCTLVGAVPASVASQIEVIADTAMVVTIRAMQADCNQDWRVVDD